MTKIDTKFEDNSEQILKELESKTNEILNAFGTELYKSIYNFMTKDSIVDTGRLRGSISYSTPDSDYKNPTPANKDDDFIQGVREKNTIVYGSNVEYANFVETGTSKQKARHYVLTGTNRAKRKLKKVAERILKGE